MENMLKVLTASELEIIQSALEKHTCTGIHTHIHTAGHTTGHICFWAVCDFAAFSFHIRHTGCHKISRAEIEVDVHKSGRWEREGQLGEVRQVRAARGVSGVSVGVRLLQHGTGQALLGWVFNMCSDFHVRHIKKKDFNNVFHYATWGRQRKGRGENRAEK